LMARSLVLSTRDDFLSLLFRFGVFVERMWLAKARALLTRPDPVRENRFAAPRCVFTLGITLVSLIDFNSTYFFGDMIMIMFRPSSRGGWSTTPTSLRASRISAITLTPISV